MEAYMMWIWLGVFVITVIVEASTQDFVSIWFSIGSLVALCINGFSPFWVEIIVFTVVSCVALVFTRPLVKKLMTTTERFTNIDEIVGKQVVCQHDISKFSSGEVKLNGLIYTAVLMEDSDKAISKGTIVEIVAIRGNKLVVKEVTNNNGSIEILNTKGE